MPFFGFSKGNKDRVYIATYPKSTDDSMSQTELESSCKWNILILPKVESASGQGRRISPQQNLAISGQTPPGAEGKVLLGKVENRNKLDQRLAEASTWDKLSDYEWVKQVGEDLLVHPNALKASVNDWDVEVRAKLLLFRTNNPDGPPAPPVTIKYKEPRKKWKKVHREDNIDLS